MKAMTRAVITFIIGGIDTLKYAAGSSADDTASSDADVSTKDGNTAAPVRYDIVPARTVDPYAIATVSRSIFPAPLPMSAMATVTRPRMINGMAKPKNWLNIPLKVTNMRTSQAGAMSPIPTPSAIAIRILPKRPIFILFILFYVKHISRKRLVRYLDAFDIKVKSFAGIIFEIVNLKIVEALCKAYAAGK